MAEGNLLIEPIIELGPVVITNTVVTTWVIMAVIGLLAWLVSRRLRIDPGPVQTAVEGIVSSIEDAVTEVAPQHAPQIMPFIGSLWIFLVVANLSGLIPGMHSPTRDLSATAALAIVVFLSTHWFGIRIQG
ncbi:MAG TPA: F0F1 ATP synthase subunit A, partial [Halieaceae bacterium]|nr:F0F1 ATP synthase subunit A [Halieaceae bacterium]